LGKQTPLYIVDEGISRPLKKNSQYLSQFKINIPFDPAIFSLRHTKTERSIAYSSKNKEKRKTISPSTRKELNKP